MKTRTVTRIGLQNKLAAMVGLISLFYGAIVSHAQEPASDRIQAHWKFDEGSGLSASDASGNGNTGALTGFDGEEAQWVEGVDGGALQFGSGNTFVEVPDSPSIGSELVDGLTIATWLKPNDDLAAGGGGNRALEKEDSYFLLQGVVEGGMNFLVKQQGSNVTAGLGEALEADEWHHITGTFDGTDLRIYLDGELKNTVEVGADIDDPGGVLTIGSDVSGTFFNGAMDEVTIWDRALNEEEIKQILANDGEPVSGPPQVTSQPESRSVFPGSKVTFSVEVGGTEPFEFQWLKGGEVVRGAESATLVLENIQAEDAGDYKVSVSNAAGEVESEVASLTVKSVEDLQTAQVAFWKFDEESGLVAADSSGNGHNGDLMGYEGEESQWVSGQVGGALQFDKGQANRVVIPESGDVEFGDNLSVTFWLKPETFGLGQDAGSFTWFESFIARKGEQLSVSIANDPSQSASKSVMFGGTGAFLGSPKTRPDLGAGPGNLVELGAWQHFTMVFTEDEVTFYKDGFQIGAPREAAVGPKNSLNLVLGNVSEGTESARFFDGLMDELGIWRRPLNENEILELAGRDAEGAPSIVRAPTSKSVLAGSLVEFSVRAEGKRPLSYQWRVDGEPLPEATDRVLTLSDVTPEASGSYSVRITNEKGETTSGSAALEVQPIEDVTSGLVAYWDFDKVDDGILSDESGNGHDGQLENFDGSPVQEGFIEGAFQFPGNDEFITVPHDKQLSLEGEATFSFWIRPASFGQPQEDWGRILRKGSNYAIFMRAPESHLWLRKGTEQGLPGNTPAGSVELEVWQHFAMVVKEGTRQFFKNGQPLGPSEPYAGALGPPSTDDLAIGNFQATLEPVRLYQGLMDDLGIWNRALNEQEVEGIYQNGTLGKPLTQEFEPLTIRSLELLPSEGQVVLTFFSPFTDRELAVQRSADLGAGEWTGKSDASFSELGEGEYEATVPMPSGDPHYYRVVALAKPAILEADFEAEAGEWTHGGENDSWEVGAPMSGPGEAVSGENVFATNLDGNFEANTDAYLRSPVVDLTEVDRATLSFQEFRNVDPEISFHYAAVNLLNAEDNSVIRELSRDSGQTDGWQERSFTIGPDALGNEVKIEFRLATDAFNQLPGWYIDDVVIRPE